MSSKTFPFKSVSQYNNFMAIRQRDITTRQLLAEARQAAAWGVPDHESIGYSQADLCSMIYQLIAKIEELDSIVQLNKQ